MQDIEKLGRELQKQGKTDKLKSIAESEEGKAVMDVIDGAEVERAAKAGDAAALKTILAQVLSTDEGKRLAAKLKDAMK